MRVRVTLMTSNDVPVTDISEDREEAIDMITNAWSIFLLSLKGGAHNSDGYVEKVEILDEAEESMSKIEVGDEVTAYNELIRKEEHFVVIEVGGYFGEGNVGLFALYGNDKSSVDFKAGCYSTSVKDVTKTGKHYDIEKLLEVMRHD